MYCAVVTSQTNTHTQTLVIFYLGNALWSFGTPYSPQQECGHGEYPQKIPERITPTQKVSIWTKVVEP